VLDQNRIAQGEIRCRQSYHLIERKIPGLHAQDHAQRSIQDFGVAVLDVDVLLPQKARGVVAVISQDGRRKIDLRLRFDEALAHLERNYSGELVFTFEHEFARAFDLARAFADRQFAPL